MPRGVKYMVTGWPTLVTAFSGAICSDGEPQRVQHGLPPSSLQAPPVPSALHVPPSALIGAFGSLRTPFCGHSLNDFVGVALVALATLGGVVDEPCIVVEIPTNVVTVTRIRMREISNIGLMINSSIVRGGM